MIGLIQRVAEAGEELPIIGYDIAVVKDDVLCPPLCNHVAVGQPGGASFALAAERGFSTLAVPAIGTGIGGLALQRCAELSLEEARLHLAGETTLEEIRFVLFGEPAFRVFEMVNDSAMVAAQMERLAKVRERK